MQIVEVQDNREKPVRNLAAIQTDGKTNTA